MDRKQFNRVVSAALVLRAVYKEVNISCMDLHTLIGDAFCSLNVEKQKEVKKPQRIYINNDNFELPTDDDMNFVRSNYKLDAVKSYKNRTGCSLMNSKSIIEAYSEHLGLYGRGTSGHHFEIK